MTLNMIKAVRKKAGFVSEIFTLTCTPLTREPSNSLSLILFQSALFCDKKVSSYVLV